jgi:hypothetical protein
MRDFYHSPDGGLKAIRSTVVLASSVFLCRRIRFLSAFCFLSCSRCRLANVFCFFAIGLSGGRLDGIPEDGLGRRPTLYDSNVQYCGPRIGDS